MTELPRLKFSQNRQEMNSDQSVVERLQEAYEVLHDEVHKKTPRKARVTRRRKVVKVWVSVFFFFRVWVFGNQNLVTWKGFPGI